MVLILVGDGGVAGEVLLTPEVTHPLAAALHTYVHNTHNVQSGEEKVM
jgi:hypothetical protein